jgi:hypothetical protein
MYGVYIFFSYSFVEFLETGKINVTVPPVFGGTQTAYSHTWLNCPIHIGGEVNTVLTSDNLL